VKRRAHFDAGEFVEEWGDEGAKNNFCLYKVGCKGPMTFNNCSIIRYNEGVNWPVGVGRGCIGCSEPDFWDKYAYERPMANANIKAQTGWEFEKDRWMRFGIWGLLNQLGQGGWELGQFHWPNKVRLLLGQGKKGGSWKKEGQGKEGKLGRRVNGGYFGLAGNTYYQPG